MSDMKSLSGIQFMDSGAIMRAVNGGGGTMSQPQAVRPRIVCSKANACRFRLLSRFVCAYKKLSVTMPFCTHHRQCSSKLARTSWPPTTQPIPLSSRHFEFLRMYPPKAARTAYENAFSAQINRFNTHSCSFIVTACISLVLSSAAMAGRSERSDVIV